LKLPHFPKPSWLNRLGLAVTSVLAIAAGFILASLLFTVLLIAGLAVGGWLWWQFRRLARSARAAAPDVIEGEYTVESAHPLLENRGAPDQEPPVSPPPRRPS